MTSPTPRDVNYDDIAHLYDAQPYRDKQPDAALLARHRDHPARARKNRRRTYSCEWKPPRPCVR